MVTASLDDGTMVGGLEAVAKDPMMGGDVDYSQPFSILYLGISQTSEGSHHNTN